MAVSDITCTEEGGMEKYLEVVSVKVNGVKRLMHTSLMTHVCLLHYGEMPMFAAEGIPWPCICIHGYKCRIECEDVHV